MKFRFIFFITILSPILGNGQLWKPLMNGIGDTPVEMYADSTENVLYVSGRFDTAGTIHAKGIAKWNGVYWDSLGFGLDAFDSLNHLPNGLAYGMTRYNGNLYVCGNFISLGNVGAKSMGYWNGTAWDSILIQPQIPITKALDELFTINNELYACGRFDSIGGINANSIAKWDGTAWTAINFPNFSSPSLPYPAITSICEYHGKIYAAGLIKTYPVDTIGDIMSYDGINWQTVGGGIKGLSTSISSMVVYNDELYVAGGFSKIDGNAGNNIQKWNDSIWIDVGNGTGGNNGSIYKLLVYHQKLYAFGVFITSGNIPSHRISQWDGSKWCGLGSNFNNILITAAIMNDSLYIGGGFTNIDSNNINYIAQWNGGSFVDTCQSNVGIAENENDNFSLVAYPNPTTGKLNVKLPINILNKTSILITDLLGRKLKAYDFTNTTGNYILDLNGFENGVYLVSLVNDGLLITNKIIKNE